jgi:hypothetical protein
VEQDQTLIRLVVGLGLTAVVLLLAGHRIWWLLRLVRSGQPATGRTDNLGKRVMTQVEEVLGRPGCCDGRFPAWRTSSRCGVSSSC